MLGPYLTPDNLTCKKEIAGLLWVMTHRGSFHPQVVGEPLSPFPSINTEPKREIFMFRKGVGRKVSPAVHVCAIEQIF